MLRLARASLLLAFACLATGCFDDSSDIPVATYPTMLTIDPASFRGTVRCGAGELAKYVVTLSDVSVVLPSEDGGIVYEVLPSSAPVACNAVASFGDPPLVVGHYYTGSIDGYDRDDIAPAEVGSRVMYDSSGQVVLPRWTTTCGEVPPFRRADAGDAEPFDASAYNPLRYPTPVLGTADVTLRGCLAFSNSPGPDGSTDANPGEDRADAASEAESGPNTAEDASPDDHADGAPEDASSDGSEGGEGE